jgi:hypothetical protein
VDKALTSACRGSRLQGARRVGRHSPCDQLPTLGSFFPRQFLLPKVSDFWLPVMGLIRCVAAPFG